MGDFQSQWSEVLSGVPQGSVLGPTLFIIYINDLPENLFNVTKIYADDTKIIADVSNPKSISDLQSDLNEVVKWSERWLIKLNVNKCKIMHLGKLNPKQKYYIKVKDDQKVLSTTGIERDLGVTWTNNLSWSEQCNKAAAKANCVMGMLKHAFVSRDSKIWRKLYMTYIRPQLEFCVSVWSPFLKAEVSTLEKVQRRATKIPHRLKNMSYSERCSKWSLTSLYERRARGDLINFFKFRQGFDLINWHHPPLMRNERAGRRQQFCRELVKNSLIRHNFFLNRVANAWNCLPDEIANAKTIVDFKVKLDNYAKGCYSKPPTCGLLRR